MDKCSECTCGGKGGLYCEWIRPHPQAFLARIEALERELAEERSLCDRLARAISDDLDSWPLHMLDGSVIARLVRQWRNKRGEG